MSCDRHESLESLCAAAKRKLTKPSIDIAKASVVRITRFCHTHLCRPLPHVSSQPQPARSLRTSSDSNMRGPLRLLPATGLVGFASQWAFCVTPHRLPSQATQLVLGPSCIQRHNAATCHSGHDKALFPSSHCKAAVSRLSECHQRCSSIA